MTVDRRLLHRVALRNYRSIAACDVSLAQLSFLVGPNGSGKSNFLDALGFSIDHALRDNDRKAGSPHRLRSTGALANSGVEWRAASRSSAHDA